MSQHGVQRVQCVALTTASGLNVETTTTKAPAESELFRVGALEKPVSGLGLHAVRAFSEDDFLVL